MVPDETTLELVALCVAAKEPSSQARFWAEALRWEVGGTDDDGSVHLVPTDGTRFRLRFVPTTTEKVGLDRAHLDLTTTSFADQEETVAHLLSQGARHLDVGQGPEESHVVLADPEGNELCIIGPENRFLAGCPRLGAISCDGSQAVGYFWSAVLGWPLVWDQDEETAIRAPDGTGPKISWGGPPVAPKHGENRLHLDLAAPTDVGLTAAADHLVSLGARRLDGPGHLGGLRLVDPDDNELCLLDPQ